MEITVTDEYGTSTIVTLTEEAPGGFSLTSGNQPAGILTICEDEYEYHGELSIEVSEQVAKFLTNQ